MPKNKNINSSSSGFGYGHNPYASEPPAKIDEHWKKEDEDKIFVLSSSGYGQNPYASEPPAKIDENWKKKTDDHIYVLLRCYHDPDEHFVDDQFVTVSHSSECLEEHARKLGATHVYLDGDDVPDDEIYVSKRARFRIVRVGILK